MHSDDYLRAWGFPKVFEDVDRLIDIRTRICRREMAVVKGGMSRRFDLFWEFEQGSRIRRVVFELKENPHLDWNELQWQLDDIRASYLDLRPILLVPDGDDRRNMELKSRFARDVLILPGWESMRIDADGAHSLPPIDVTRTYCCPHEVVRFDLRMHRGSYDVRRLLSNPSPFAYDQLMVFEEGDIRPLPFFKYLKRVAHDRGLASRRGGTREYDLQFDRPVRIEGPEGCVYASRLHVVYASGRRIKSVIRVSPVAMALSRVANEEVSRESYVMDSWMKSK